MAAYLQMGNDTENLVGETDLEEFQGIILSPVNRKPLELQGDIPSFKAKKDYDVVLDPQLYLPRSERGSLNEHPYFQSDLDTSKDLLSEWWWRDIVRKLAVYVKELSVDCVASPVILPKAWSDEYFALCATVSEMLSDELNNNGIPTFMTVLINYNQIGEQDQPLRIASLISEAQPSGYYLVISSDIRPRLEFSDPEALFGIMSLTQELENTGKPVLVSHCSSDMLLCKSASASHCATGKFFNLRRFTRSRYEEPAGGGGQLPYIFEQSLMAFLRRADVIRLKRDGYGHFVGRYYSANFWSDKIFEHFDTNPKEPWVRLGWRQYLSWFGKTEITMSLPDARPTLNDWLKSAEQNWLTLDDEGALLEEPRNNGSWIRPWRQALARFLKHYDETYNKRTAISTDSDNSMLDSQSE